MTIGDQSTSIPEKWQEVTNGPVVPFYLVLCLSLSSPRKNPSCPVNFFEILFEMAKGGFKRKPNWTEDECLFLAELVEERKDIIKGKFGPSLTSAKKKTAWKDIADRINEAFPRTTRTPLDAERNSAWARQAPRASPPEQFGTYLVMFLGPPPYENNMPTLPNWDGLPV